MSAYLFFMSLKRHPPPASSPHIVLCSLFSACVKNPFLPPPASISSAPKLLAKISGRRPTAFVDNLALDNALFVDRSTPPAAPFKLVSLPLNLADAVMPAAADILRQLHQVKHILL